MSGEQLIFLFLWCTSATQADLLFGWNLARTFEPVIKQDPAELSAKVADFNRLNPLNVDFNPYQQRFQNRTLINFNFTEYPRWTLSVRYPDITLEDIGVIDTISVGQLNDWISAFPEMVNNGQSNNIESILMSKLEVTTQDVSDKSELLTKCEYEKIAEKTSNKFEELLGNFWTRNNKDIVEHWNASEVMVYELQDGILDCRRQSPAAEMESGLRAELEREILNFLKVEKCLDQAVPLTQGSWAAWNIFVNHQKSSIERLYKLMSGDLIRPTLEDAMNVENEQEFVKNETVMSVDIGPNPENPEEHFMNYTVTTHTDVLGYVCFDSHSVTCSNSLNRMVDSFDEFCNNTDNIVDGASKNLMNFTDIVKAVFNYSHNDPNITIKLGCTETMPDRVVIYDMHPNVTITKRWVPRYVSYNTLFGTYEVPVPGYNYTILQAAPQPDTSNGLIQRFGIHITEGLRAMLAYNYILFRIPDNPVARKYKTGCQLRGNSADDLEEYGGKIKLKIKSTLRRDGNWGEWTEWSNDCSNVRDMCGGGYSHPSRVRTRSRKCDSPKPINGGLDCGAQKKRGNGGLDTVESVFSDCRVESDNSEEIRYQHYQRDECPSQECPKIDGGWGEWYGWSQCSQTCGPGKTYNMRRCVVPPPSLDPPGNPCTPANHAVPEYDSQGVQVEMWEKDCKSDTCPLNSGFPFDDSEAADELRKLEHKAYVICSRTMANKEAWNNKLYQDCLKEVMDGLLSEQ